MAVENKNSINSQKYGYALIAIEEKAIETKRFREFTILQTFKSKTTCRKI